MCVCAKYASMCVHFLSLGDTALWCGHVPSCIPCLHYELTELFVPLLGWVTVGPELTSSNFNPKVYASLFEKDESLLLPFDEKIEELRPKSPPQKSGGRGRGLGGPSMATALECNQNHLCSEDSIWGYCKYICVGPSVGQWKCMALYCGEP